MKTITRTTAEENPTGPDYHEASTRDGEIALALGHADLSTRDFETALENFSLATQLLPKRAAAHAGQALALQSLGRSSEASHAALHAVSLDPSNATALKVLARIHLDAGQPEAAQNACRRILKANLADADALNLLREAITQEAKLAENIVDVRPRMAGQPA